MPGFTPVRWVTPPATARFVTIVARSIKQGAHDGAILAVLSESTACGMTRLIGAQPDLDLIGVCVDLPTLLEQVDAESPDVVVTDIRMAPTGTDEGIGAADPAADLPSRQRCTPGPCRRPTSPSAPKAAAAPGPLTPSNHAG
jgi:hypothetical protein